MYGSAWLFSSTPECRLNHQSRGRRKNDEWWIGVCHFKLHMSLSEWKLPWTLDSNFWFVCIIPVLCLYGFMKTLSIKTELIVLKGTVQVNVAVGCFCAVCKGQTERCPRQVSHDSPLFSSRHQPSSRFNQRCYNWITTIYCLFLLAFNSRKDELTASCVDK